MAVKELKKFVKFTHTHSIHLSMSLIQGHVNIRIETGQFLTFLLET